ncbi:hypothetical protein TorRG33x02_263010, partial [Trema orientale]
GDLLAGRTGGKPHIGREGAVPHAGHTGGTLCAGRMGFAPLSWPRGLHPALVAVQASSCSCGCVGAVLNGGRMGTLRACGRTGFVSCVAAWCPKAVVFPTDPVLAFLSVSRCH